MFRLVLVIVLLVVQMVGAMPLLFVGGGMGWGTRIQVVALPVARCARVMWASVDGAAFGGVAEGGADVGGSDAGSVVGHVLVVSACGSRPQVVYQAMPPVRLVQVVSVTVGLMPLVRAVWFLVVSGVGGFGDADGGVLVVGAGGGAPMVRAPGALGVAPRCRAISLPLLAEGAAGVAAGEGGGCDGVVVVVGAAWGGC